MSALARLHRRHGLGLRAPGLLGPELVCVALADALFWGHPTGLSVPLFCLAVALVAWTARPMRAASSRRALAVAVLALALAPAVERVTPLSLVFADVGTAWSLRLCAPRGTAGGPGRLRAAARRLVSGPLQVAADTRRRRAQRARRIRVRPASRWIAWIVPSVLLAVFLALLAQANPLISDALLALPLPSWADLWGLVPRVAFWAVVLAGVWPAIRARRPRPRPVATPSPRLEAGSPGRWTGLAALLLSPAALLRALLLLDALFTVQLGLDGAYLWGGLALPRGLTYAAYAHRGAYPLVVTALLAAALVLVVRRPGAIPPTRAASALLLLFLAQNALLVVSAMERLSLYVAAYGLTELRVAAFAWMGLVTVGLGLVALQGALGRDGRWLVGRSMAAALALLYGWCLIGVPRLVADYDVAHCAELRGEGPALDLDLVRSLGPDAIPAVDRYLLGFRPAEQRDALTSWRAGAAAAVRHALRDWRGWSLRGWRLARYLDTSGVDEPAVPAPSDGEDG